MISPRAIEVGARALVATGCVTNLLEAAHLSYKMVTALAAEGVAVADMADLNRVVEIAARNEASPEIERLKSMINAAQPATKDTSNANQ